MFNATTYTFDRTAIAREVRRIARIYTALGSRKARMIGYRQAMERAEGIKRIVLRDATMCPKARARRDEAIAIQCSTDGRLSNEDYSRLNELGRAA